MVYCMCVMRGEGIEGHLTLEQETEEAPTVIKGEIKGLRVGLHGFAVHVFGDLRQAPDSVEGHFNPYNKKHGAPQDDERHVGSLGNIHADASGKAEIHVEDKLVKLIGPYSIIGRALAIGENEDDLGKGGVPPSERNGNVGALVAYGVIGIGQKRA